MAKLDDKKKCKKFPFADVLKWAIFSLVMLAPFGAVLGKVAYVTFNKNAKDSYSGSYSYQSTQKINTFLNTTSASIRSESIVNSITNYKIDNYNLGGTFYSIPYNNQSIETNVTNQSQLTFNVSYLKVNNTVYNNALSFNLQRYNSNYFIFIYNVTFDYTSMYSNLRASSQNYYYNQDGNITATSSIGINLSNNNYNITFINADNNLYYRGDYTWSSIFEKNIFFVDNTLSNVFYSSLSDINNAPIFNWTQNTAMYTVIDNMTNDLEINTNGNILATLLTYWTLNTAVYLIFDVVIHFSTKLVHMFSGE